MTLLTLDHQDSSCQCSTIRFIQPMTRKPRNKSQRQDLDDFLELFISLWRLHWRQRSCRRSRWSCRKLFVSCCAPCFLSSPLLLQCSDCGKWESWICSSKKVIKSQCSSVVKSLSDCSPGWTEYDKICLSPNNNSMNWSEARQHCYSQQAFLPSSNISSELMDVLCQYSEGSSMWLQDEPHAPRERKRRIINLSQENQDENFCSVITNETVIDSKSCNSLQMAICVKPIMMRKLF